LNYKNKLLKACNVLMIHYFVKRNKEKVNSIILFTISIGNIFIVQFNRLDCSIWDKFNFHISNGYQNGHRRNISQVLHQLISQSRSWISRN